MQPYGCVTERVCFGRTLSARVWSAIRKHCCVCVCVCGCTFGQWFIKKSPSKYCLQVDSEITTQRKGVWRGRIRWKGNHKHIHQWKRSKQAHHVHFQHVCAARRVCACAVREHSVTAQKRGMHGLLSSLGAWFAMMKKHPKICIQLFGSLHQH